LRYIIRGIIITLLSAFVVFKFGIPLFHALTTQDRQYQKRMERSIVSISYILDDKKWTTFPIPMTGSQARAVTNANLPASYEMKPGEEQRYVYQFQVMDGDENILADRIYHNRTKITNFKDEDGDTFTNSFYTDSDLTPFDSRSMRIDFSGIEGEKFIRFRLLSKDISVSDVILRLYIYLEHEKEQPGYLWRRLSDKQKTRLTKGNVYPHELLAEEEKRNLIQRSWIPLGPLGADNADYKSRKLYVLQESEGEAADFDLPPSGLYIKEGHRGIIPVPEEGGRIRLEFLNMSGRSPQDIRLRWYGRGIGMRMDYTVSWKDDSSAFFEELFKGGMIEISPLNNTAVRAFLINGDEETEMTPEPVYVRSFITGPGLPVEYKIHHTGDKPTPFKAVFRCQIPKQKDAASGNLRYADYQLLDKGGGIVRSGSIPLAENLSLYDTIAGNPDDRDISDPIVYNFYIPLSADSIRFSSGADLLVAAYTRPDGMIREVMVPEDYYAATAQEEKQPGWFAVRPGNYKKLVYGDRSLLLITQPRPAEDNEDLMAGRYLWEDFQPEGGRPSRYILAEEAMADAGGRERRGYYSMLSLNRNMTVEFTPIAGLAKISPTLIYIRKSPEPASLKFFLDNALHYETRIAGTRGEIELPPVRFGRHNIRVESQGKAEFFLNNIKGGPRVFLKRFVNRIDKKGLDFTYDKKTPSDELLSVRFYSPSKNMERNTIMASVDIEKLLLLEPFESWTFSRQRFSIKPDPTEPVAVLNTYSDYLESGQLFFIRLGSDLPPGDYHIRFNLESGTGGYLSLHRVTPGLFEERKFYKEKGLTDDIIVY